MHRAVSQVSGKRAKVLMRQWLRKEVVPIPALQHQIDPQAMRIHNVERFTVDSLPPLADWDIQLLKGTSFSYRRWSPAILRQRWRKTEEKEVRPPLKIDSAYASMLTKKA